MAKAAWYQARLSGDRAQILRSQQGSGHLALHGRGRADHGAPAVAARRGGRRAPIAPLAPEAEVAEAAEVELVSLEEADAEAEGKKVPVEGEEEEVEVADDPADDATFLETDEDEGDDVTDIIGGEREDEEDT